MSETTAGFEPRSRSGLLVGVALALSLGAHAAIFSLLVARHAESSAVALNKSIDVEIVEVERKPPPPPAVPEPQPEPRKEEPHPTPRILRVAKVRPPPPPRAVAPPPPPNQPPPHADVPPPPINVGVSLPSTIASGSFAAPVGNTLYGQVAAKAVNPRASKGYTPAETGDDSEPVIGPGYNAAYLHNPPPRYPPVRRRSEAAGYDDTSVLVNPDGHPRPHRSREELGRSASR